MTGGGRPGRKGAVAGAVVLAALAPACNAAPDTRPDDATLAGAVTAHVRALAGFGFNGVVLVSRGGEIVVHEGLGLGDPAGRPVTTRTVFDIASITKGFTAAGVLEAERRGLLATLAPITELLDSVPPDKRAITLSHLLTHTSGLPRNLGSDYDTVTAEALVAAATDAETSAPPGVRYRY